MRRRFILGLTIIVAIAIAYLSLSPKPAVTASNDKLGHFIAYSVFTLLLFSSFRTNTLKRVALLLAVAVLYGVVMEFGQRFVPGRSFSVYDMIANTAGALIGFLTHFFVSKYQTKYRI